MGLTNVLVYLLLALPLGLAHPHGEEEKVYLHAAQPINRRTLAHCQSELQDPEFVKRTIARRRAEVQRLKRARGIEHIPIISGRQQGGYLNKDHQVKKPFNKDTKPAELFADDGACVLAPLVSEGPLYVSGEQVRKNITENEKGIPMTLEIQVVDVRTCKPMRDLAIDVWGCNATGIYSGVLNYRRVPNHGAGYDKSVLNATALRGIQFTNEDGVASFDSNFPGHYEGRAIHIHAMVHAGVKKEANGTISGGNIPHIAQLYFDQSLITNIEKISPYVTNKQPYTPNNKDGLLATTLGGDDPFLRYVMLGNKVEDGLFAYTRFGIDAKSAWTVSPAAFRDESGGHQNPNGPMGDGSVNPMIPPNPIPTYKPGDP